MRDVTFYAPSIGKTSVPMGLNGKGQADWTSEGIRLHGPLHSKNAASLFGCLGFIVGFAGAIALLMATGITAKSIAGKLVIVGAILLAFGAVKLGRVVFPPKMVEILIPWESIKKLGAEEGYVTFLSSAKPKGQVWFTLEPAVTPGAADAGLNEVLADIRRVASGRGVSL